MITTRILEVEHANSRGQLPRRNTQTSDTYWEDFGRRQCAEVEDTLSLGEQERIRFNVSGTIYETFSQTLLRFPDTLLGSAEQLTSYYDQNNDCYFFDRNRDAFESILFFYQSYGRLIKPANLGLKLFIEELKFFKMGEEIINRFMVKFRYHDGNVVHEVDKQSIRAGVWNFFEYPKSRLATSVAFSTVLIICISVTQFCVETVPYIKKNFSKQLFEVECFCVAWFTIEFLLRFLSAPEKRKFMKSLMNLVDLLSILPFYMTLFSQLIPKRKEAPFESLRVLRLVRVLRIFKLSRHLTIFKILGLTIKSSFRELILLLFFLLTAVVLFSSAIYSADKSFISIPDAFWFSIITITNVGYGDSVPTTTPGKFIGSICAVCGTVILALPIPVFVSSFMYFYNMEKENHKLEKQEKEQRKKLETQMTAQVAKNTSLKMTEKHTTTTTVSPSQSEMGGDRSNNMSGTCAGASAPESVK